MKKKNINSIHFLLGLIVPLLMLSSGCKKDFLEKPPTDAIVDANFYQTDEQVLAASSLLYSKVWFDYNDKASYNLGDFRAGTAFSAYNDRGNVLFNTTDITPENGAAWRSFFIVVGQSNLAINNINKYASPSVSPEIKKIAIAEARFMRAVAYRYLTMNWGDVPIIENNLELLNDTTIHKNTAKSVWRFITREMRAVANDLPATAIQTGRITKWSAEGMLARFYLSRAGVEAVGGARNQVFLDSAKYFAQRVITNSGRSLLKNYSDLFLYPYDNNAESLFELQWVALSGDPGYGVGNSTPSYLNYSADISVEGWGGDKGATWWMLSQYEGITAFGDTMLKGRTLDQRLKATYMLPGASYPEITQKLNGVNQKLVFPYTAGDVNFASIKKYVVGKSEDLKFIVEAQRYPNNTYMLRLAEMYLIYAEATLGNNASTADATALDYFNKVHTRAGLPTRTDPLTLDDILKERFIEFAMEGQGWYDLVSLHYYNPDKAYSILNSQDRGIYNIAPDVFPNPTSWTFKKTVWATTERKIVANSGNFLLPIPAQEKSQAPNLAKPAVDYP
ncbi:MAG: RagB/SusD domain protein [Ferruginibacter sp.]|nr:RagB/SusD domain protein [Ferruginibacter sp.]